MPRTTAARAELQDPRSMRDFSKVAAGRFLHNTRAQTAAAKAMKSIAKAKLKARTKRAPALVPESETRPFDREDLDPS